MRMIRWLVCGLVLTIAPIMAAAADAAASAATVNELVGLWKAQRWFGPDTHGPLIVQRSGATFSADMLGRILPVHMDGGELAFDLPNGQGRFRGKLQGNGDFLGHWFRPGTLVNSGESVLRVLLKADGANRWRGDVAQSQDEFTFYLLLRERPDGSLSAVLRNPERDVGTQIGVERLTRDGNAVKLVGKRRGQKAEQELARGIYDAEDHVITLTFPNRGGSYDFRRDDDASEFYPRGRNPERYRYRPPPARDDGWPAASLDAVDIDQAGIEQFIQKILDAPMDSADSLQIHAVLIARHGKLVLEEYFHGEHRDRLHQTRSASKSAVAVLVGAVMKAGAPLALSSPVYQMMNGGVVPADPEPRKRSMTLEHLLTMSSGYFCDDSNDAAPGNEETMQDQTAEPDYYRYTLNVPMATTPGENSVYCSANPNLALGMVGRATGENPIYSFDRLVAGPLRISRYNWPLDPAGNPYGGGGIEFLARDFMKFGQLMLNDGTWQGHRILSHDFVARATAHLYHLRNLYYGYLWWSEDFPYKRRVVHAFMALGAGGQIVTVVPELDLVVATYAANYSSAAQKDLGHHYVPRSILPAVRERGDDKNAPVIDQEYQTPYGASTDGSRVSEKD